MIIPQCMVLVIGYLGRNPEGRVIDVDQWGFAHVLVGLITTYRHIDTLQRITQHG